MMLILVSMASASCGVGSLQPVPMRVKQSAYSYRARVVGLEAVPRRPQKGGYTKVTLAVREVYNGEVPDVVVGTFYGQPQDNWHRMDTNEHVPVLGDELIVTTHEREPRLRFACRSTLHVFPDTSWPGLTPLRTRALPPGPKETYIEALAHCDIDGVQRGIDGKLRIPLEPLGNCPRSVMDRYMKPLGPYVALPPGIVENADLDDLVWLLDRHPSAGEDALERAIRVGRADLLEASPALIKRFPERTTLYEVAPIPDLIAVLLEHTAPRQPALHQALNNCFHHSDSANRVQRHDAARKLIAAGAPATSPNAWPAISVFFSAVEDQFPSDEILELLRTVPRVHKADAVRATAERAAQFGRIDLLDAVWAEFEHPPDGERIAKSTCHHSLDTMNHVRALLSTTEPVLDIHCAQKAVETGALDVLNAVLAQPQNDVSWDQAWAIAWRSGHRAILERLQATHPRRASWGDLQLAIRSGRAASVAYAIQLGAPVRDGEGASGLQELLLSLRYASEGFEDAEIARALLDAGASLDDVFWDVAYLGASRPELYAVLREAKPTP